MLHDCPYSLSSFVIFSLNPSYAFHTAFLNFTSSCSLLILINDLFKHYNIKHCIKVHITTAITSLIPRQRCPIKWWCLQPNPPPVRRNLRKRKVCKSREFAIRYGTHCHPRRPRKCWTFGIKCICSQRSEESLVRLVRSNTLNIVIIHDF